MEEYTALRRKEARKRGREFEERCRYGVMGLCKEAVPKATRAKKINNVYQVLLTSYRDDHVYQVLRNIVMILDFDVQDTGERRDELVDAVQTR